MQCRGDDHIEFNIKADSKKAHNLRRNPQVCLSMVAPHDARLWVVIEGEVEDISTPETNDHLNELAVRYLGRPRRHPELPRNKIDVRPTAVHWWGQDAGSPSSA